MKIKHIERMRRTMREFHRFNPWKLTGGLFIPHTYPSSSALSWWADFGFIQGGRRIMVRWVHPRMRYADAIEQKALEIAGPVPLDSPSAQRIPARTRRSQKHFSRKTARGIGRSDHLIEYFDKVNAIEDRLSQEGIDHVVFPSLKIRHYPWGMGMDLCANFKIREVADIRSLANVARRLIRREIRLGEAFPSIGYSKEDWIRESSQRRPQSPKD